MSENVQPVKPLRRLVVVSASGDHTESVFADMFDEVLVVHHEETDLDYPELDPNTVVIFEGGTDINPAYYGEYRNVFTQTPNMPRDMHEFALFHRCLRMKTAMIGICRGAQLLCAGAGARLIQHVTGHTGSSHEIFTSDGRVMKAASDHHQMMFPYGLQTSSSQKPDGWQLLAWAKNPLSGCYLNGKNDHIITPSGWQEPEICWFPKQRALAIQPHPEWMNLNEEFPQYCRKLVADYIFKQQEQREKNFA